jgi:hypothetical protein
VCIRSRSVDRSDTRYVEALLGDSSVAVIAHKRSDNSFVALYCQGLGSGQIYRSGTLTWNAVGRRWVVFDFSIDYGTAARSREMFREYRGLVGAAGSVERGRG